MLAFLFVFGSFLFAFLSFVFFQFQMLTACVLVWRAWCRHVRLNLTIRRPRLRWPDCVSWRRLQPTHPLFAQNVIPSTVSGSLISSCLFFYQHYLCVVLLSLPAFVSTACVWYSHQFLSLSAVSVCGFLISSFLCQQCLCVVLSSLPVFVSTTCVWYSHHFLCCVLFVCFQYCLRPPDQGDVLSCLFAHNIFALPMSVTDSFQASKVLAASSQIITTLYVSVIIRTLIIC